MNKTCAECTSKENCENVAYFRKHQYPLTSMTCPAWAPEKKPTNGDRIRSMTDEELLGVLFNSYCDKCSYVYRECADLSCKDGITEWLKKEAEDVSNG